MKTLPLCYIGLPNYVQALVFTLTVLCLGVGFTSTADAQALASGTRVRIVDGDLRTVGNVYRATPDSLVIGRATGGPFAVAWTDVDRVEYSVGSRTNAGRGALIGAGVMTALVIGGLIFASDDGSSGDSVYVDDDWGVVLGIVALPMFAAVGAGVGALVGLTVRTERWKELPIGISSGSAQAEFGVSLAIRL